MSKEEKIPGQILWELDKEIERVEELLKHFTPGTRHKVEGTVARDLPIGKTATNLWHRFREQTISELHALQEARKKHVRSPATAPPHISKLACPHCGYDGEFAENGERIVNSERKGPGFRVLQPVLEPRYISSYKDGVMTLTDTSDSHDPFDQISQPQHSACIDDHDDDAVEKEFRKMLRGRWIFVCGNGECLGYFDASEFAQKAAIEYSGEPGCDDWFRR